MPAPAGSSKSIRAMGGIDLTFPWQAESGKDEVDSSPPASDDEGDGSGARRRPVLSHRIEPLIRGGCEFPFAGTGGKRREFWRYGGCRASGDMLGWMAARKISLTLDEELVRRARAQDVGEGGKSDAQVVEDALLVFLGLRALDEARAQGTLAPEAADELAVAEVRAARRAHTPA